MPKVRNFTIIAHIDHGKSTLSDRLIERCQAVEARKMREQLLDSMEIERERGITIKAQTVRLDYKTKDGEDYILNFIDTPGHVDFGYEVSRSLAACEGSILVIDATQGVEAQTLANLYKALDNNHEIIIVLNKMDLPSASPERVKQQISDIIGLDTDDTIEVSAKTGSGIVDVLEAITSKIPPPSYDVKAPLKALLIDSWYDPYLGIVVLVRIKEGKIHKGQKITMCAAQANYQVENLGIFKPEKFPVDSLAAGEIGYIAANIKKLCDCKVGDTITDSVTPCKKLLPGFQQARQVVFCSIFPVDSGDFEELKNSLSKLQLNDSSFSFETESSAALGYGFRCGFLGLLHLEIIQERLTREFNLEIVTTAPSVIYKVEIDGSIKNIHNPSDLHNAGEIDKAEEPWVKASIMLPDQYMGAVIGLCNEKRGEQISLNYNSGAAVLEYHFPLAEIILDFYDSLKSVSRGYASVDWEFVGYRTTKLVKLTILINSEPVDALSFFTHKDSAYKRGKEICERLKDIIPRQQYKIALQATIGGKIIARETINPYRKDVTAKLYGGDVTRKMKLLSKQKKGKKKLQESGKIRIPPNAFIEAMKIKN